MLGAALCKKFKIFEEKGAQGESVGIVIWVAIKKKKLKICRSRIIIILIELIPDRNNN